MPITEVLDDVDGRHKLEVRIALLDATCLLPAGCRDGRYGDEPPKEVRVGQTQRGQLPVKRVKHFGRDVRRVSLALSDGLLSR
jgi:hypothetical protein